jgi:CubicO group peptidase (beta-lactamase class C family)
MIASMMATDFIPGLSIAISQNGQTVLAKGYGYAACATSSCASGTAVQADTPFEMGSVTKAFTAIGLMRILDDPALNTSNLGALDLNAPISQYLSDNPGFTPPQQWDNITLMQLLSMSSGIEDFGSDTLTWPQILDRVGMQPLLFSPGTGYCYSNPGFMVVGAVMQALTETAYAEFMQQQVFAPAAMNDTLIHTPDNAPSNLATGYAYDASTQTWTVPTPRPPLSSFSAGALISTAVDLGTFIGALQERALLNSATYDLMWTIVMLSDPSRPGTWGLGWDVTTVGSYQIFRKDGALPGVTAQISLYDDGTSQVGVAIASNENNVVGYVQLAAQIIGAVLETPVPDPGPGGNGCTPTPCFNCPTPTPT